MFTKIIILVSIAFVVSAVELNLYRSVTELRSIQNGTGCLIYKFINGEYSHIVGGSISWEGTPFIQQEVFNTVDSLKGAMVYVRKPTACDCQLIEATIIDPNLMLLQNRETGTVFFSDHRSVEYISGRPDTGGTTLRLVFESSNTEFQGILSYLLREVSWSPTYDLFFTNDDICNIAAYANIRNNQQQEYEVTKTNLFSGDIQLVNNNNLPKYPIGASHLSKAAAPNSADQSQINPNGEEHGFYFYSLNTSYTLHQSSSIRLPFLTVDPKCNFQYRASTSISSGEYGGIFQRNYDFKPDVFIPAGVLTIRDRNVLVGQSNIPDTPKDFTQTIRIGRDNDVRFSINGTLLASSDEKSHPVWKSYQTTVTISNFKDKPVRGQLDFAGAIRTIIDESTCQTIKLNTDMINLPFLLDEGGKLNCYFKVTLTWG